MRHHIRVLFVVCANLIAYISFLELLNGVLRHLTGILGWGTTDVQASERSFFSRMFRIIVNAVVVSARRKTSNMLKGSVAIFSKSLVWCAALAVYMKKQHLEISGDETQ